VLTPCFLSLAGLFSDGNIKILEMLVDPRLPIFTLVFRINIWFMFVMRLTYFIMIVICVFILVMFFFDLFTGSYH
jgi:hypothetical protein